MVSPTNITYSVASGQTIYGGLNAVPAWRQGMTAQTWTQIGTTLESVNPRYDPSVNPNHPSSPPWWGNTGFFSIVGAWCGACYDLDNDVLWLPLSGGHADYAGNEPYKINLFAESPAWEMVRPPTGAVGNTGVLNDGQEASGFYFDGRLRAVHSYNKPVYVPGMGPAMGVTGNASYSATGGLSQPAIISPTTGEMIFQGVAATHFGGGATSGGGSCYDSLRHAIWFIPSGGGNIRYFDIAGNAWVNTGITRSASGDAGLEYLPEYDCVLWVNSGFTNDFAVIDCAANTIHYPNVTGSLVGVSVLNGKMQPRRYAPNAIAVWDNNSNTTQINTLSFASNPRTDTWQIGQLPVSGANEITPTVRATNGTYGRFFYSQRLDGFGVINDVTQQIYFYARI